MGSTERVFDCINRSQATRMLEERMRVMNQYSLNLSVVGGERWKRRSRRRGAGGGAAENEV